MVIAALVSIVLAGCGLQVPRDPEGTLERVTGGTLRVAVADNPPFTDVHDSSSPTGSEIDLVKNFADSIGAKVEYTTGGEESLVTAMEKGEVDLLVGGLTDKSPWFEKVALTGPYTTVDHADGTESAIVMAVPLGENAFLVSLEDFLQHRHESEGGKR